MQRIACILSVSVFVIVVVAVPLISQTPAFEVVSIKPNVDGPAAGPARVAADGDRFIASNAYLKMILQFAYRPPSGRTLRNSDIVGGPQWADTDRFDIEAKTSSGANPTPEQMRLMMQSMLMDRFRLKAHWEMRQMPTYNLVAAKNGVKAKLSNDQSPISIDGQRGVARTIAKPSPAGITVTMSADGMPIDVLVGTLQSYAGRPMFDKTGLQGMFDVRLQFFMESTSNNGAPPASSDPMGPTFATAIEEQLGLKLESSRGPLPVLVIDNVQKPSEN
jgi:uncharacterized protein (TIGR03435 family)